MTPPQQIDLPPRYTAMPEAELCERIAAVKLKLGKRLCVLGHHYQHDEVIQFADFIGDSLKLSRLAAEQADAKYIVFCGVHFMAESADILSAGDQAVILPNLRAGCAMADMADAAAVETALDETAALTDAKVVPVTYVNSTAAIKAVTARYGGACCTSSNVRRVFEWALRPQGDRGAGAQKIFTIPDEHLGRNTAVAMGYDLDDCTLYDGGEPHGGLSRQAVSAATFLLWKGFCYVHQQFTPQQVSAVRAQRPDIRVIVHPECPREVVAMADESGSTEQIIRAVAAGAPGSAWAVGTEVNLVQRLAARHSDRFIRPLSATGSSCMQMARIDLPHLAWALENLADGHVVNQVSVEPVLADRARLALERMVSI